MGVVNRRLLSEGRRGGIINERRADWDAWGRKGERDTGRVANSLSLLLFQQEGIENEGTEE